MTNMHRMMQLSLIVLLLGHAVFQAACVQTSSQQQEQKLTTTGYDASADAQEAAKSGEASEPKTVVTATDAYEANHAKQQDTADVDDPSDADFQPIYSSVDDSDEQDTKSTPTEIQQTLIAKKSSLVEPKTMPKGGPHVPIRQTRQLVSIDDLTLGLDQPQVTADAAVNQYEADPLDGDGTSGPQALESGMQGQKPSSNKKGIAGSNKPGAFTGGPTLVQQHGGWKSDNPETADDASEGQTTFVASGGASAGLYKHVVESLNDDLSFHLKAMSKGSSKPPRRQLLQADGQQTKDTDTAAQTPSDESNVYERETTDADGDEAVLLEKASYAASAFGLPATAVQAAQAEIEELKRQLAAQRAPKVQIDQDSDPAHDVVHDQIRVEVQPASSQTAESSAGDQQSRSHRRLFALSETPTIAMGSKGGRAGKPLWGVTYSWRRAEACEGGRHVCLCPSPNDLEADMELLHRYANRIRTYSVECPELMRMLLHHSTATPHANWLLGVWVGRDESANEAQIELLSKSLEQFPHASLMGVVVGNEAVSRRDITQAQLIEMITKVRNVVRGIAKSTNSQVLAQVPIMTAELPLSYNADLVAAVDAIGANIQPFYLGSVNTADKRWTMVAVNAVMQQYIKLQDRYKDKQVIITETGWPSKSGELDTNRASPEHAAAFAQAWVQAAEKQSVPYFYHELADAAWKTALRRGAASAARAALSKGSATRRQQPGLLSQGVLGDEHFGLVSADRQTDKGLLTPTTK